MKPPPPMLPAVGWVTASAKAVATTASTAVPPAAITSAPTRDAISLCDATIPFCARIGTEVAPVVTVSATATSAARSVRAFVMRRIIGPQGTEGTEKTEITGEAEERSTNGALSAAGLQRGPADGKSRRDTNQRTSTGLYRGGFFRSRDGWLRQPPAARV